MASRKERKNRSVYVYPDPETGTLMFKRINYGFENPESAARAGRASGKRFQSNKTRAKKLHAIGLAAKQKYVQARGDDQLVCELREKLAIVTCKIRDARRDIRYRAVTSDDLEALYAEGCKELLAQRDVLRTALNERLAIVTATVRAERGAS
jgi:hypothetical protein